MMLGSQPKLPERIKSHVAGIERSIAQFNSLKIERMPKSKTDSTPRSAMRFVVFMDINRRWYWELRSEDDQVVAKCQMGFADKAQALESINRVRTSAPKSLIFDPIGTLVDRT